MTGPIPPIVPFPVVRIPVAGPPPFNTLAVVRTQIGSTGTTGYGLFRTTLTVPTSFKLIGHDPRVEPVFQHSTSATIWLISLTDDNDFLGAVDTVTGSFADDGTWQITADMAMLIGAATFPPRHDGLECGVLASSWVLCYEPPVDEHRSPGRPTQQGLKPAASMLKRFEAARSRFLNVGNPTRTAGEDSEYIGDAAAVRDSTR